jgi:flagellar hook-length control protein FliK
VPSVASETPPHALKSPSPHPRRHTSAPERTHTSPFESLLDDSKQAAPERPLQSASDNDAPRNARPESPNPPAKSHGSKPSKTTRTADKVQSADTRKPGKPETKTETSDDEIQIPVDGQAIENVAKQVVTPVDDKPADGKPADDKPVDVKPADATPINLTSIDVTPVDSKPADLPAHDNLGAVISGIAQSQTNPVAAAVAGPVLAPPTPKPAPEAVEHAAPVAPIADTAPQVTQVAPNPEIAGKKAPQEKPADLAVLQSDPDIPPADEKPPAKFAPANQDSGKTQLAADGAVQKIDKQSDGQTDTKTDEQVNQQTEKLADKQPDTQQAAHPRAEALVNAHRGAPVDAPGPINADAQTAAPKAGQDIVQPLAFTTPSQAGPPQAISQPAAPPPYLAPQAAAVPLAGVAIEIAGKALAGKNRFEIRLDPPELGRIEVRLDVDRDGNVTSRLVADRADTLDLLRRDAAGLERALQDAGLKTADNGLQFSLRDQSTGQEQGKSGLDVAQLVVHDETLTANDAIARDYYRRIGPSGGLDIRV